MRLSGRTVAAGGLVALWLALVAVDGVSALSLAAALAAVVLGAVLAAGWPGVAKDGERIIAYGRSLLDALTDTPTADRGPNHGGADAIGTYAPEADVAGSVVKDVLRTLADELGGRRLVVWRVDRVRDAVTPEHALGDPPRPGRAAGSPLTWAVEEGSAMRVDPAPSWSHGDVVAARVDERRALSVETAPGAAPDPARLRPGAEILGALLRLVDRETGARAERERLRRVTAFLQGLSRGPDPDKVPATLARAAVDLVGGQGAVVASWDGEEGVVLSREGQDGPEPGHAFARGDGDLAHSGRAGATVRRGPGDAGERPPLATRKESWRRVVPYRVVVPVEEPGRAPGALVGVWGDRAPSDDGIALLEALGPLLSLQLRQATDLVRFRERATADALTGLPNRAAFDDRLAEEQARFHRYRRPVALMVIDLDRFKRINDTHGHEAGDAVLREVAAVVRDAVRDVDIPARYGGEELVVLMPETMIRAAQEVAERVRTAIAAATIEHGGAAIPVTASIGVTACPERVDEPRGLFERADEALYRAKEGGRDRVAVG
ncbi:MAG: GGDEF domain-containing protein [Longimicrobiales bacterium]